MPKYRCNDNRRKEKAMFDSWREHRDFWYDSPYAHAVHQAEVDAIDRGDETSEWLLTDFDTFVRNPNYKGVRSNNNPHDD